MSSPTSPTTPVVRSQNASFASTASTSHRSAAGVAEVKKPGPIDRVVASIRSRFSKKEGDVDSPKRSLKERFVAAVSRSAVSRRKETADTDLQETRRLFSLARASVNPEDHAASDDEFVVRRSNSSSDVGSVDTGAAAAVATLPEESDLQKLQRELNEAKQMITLGRQRRDLASFQIVEVRLRQQIAEGVQPELAELRRNFEAGRAHIQAQEQARKELGERETQARQAIGDLESLGHTEQTTLFGQLNLMSSEEKARTSVVTTRFQELSNGYVLFDEGRLTILYREMDPSDLAVEYSKLASDETKADSRELKCMKAVLAEKGLLGTPEGNALLKTAEKVIKLAEELAIAREQIQSLTRGRVPSATPQRPTRRTGGMLEKGLTPGRLPVQEALATVETSSRASQAVGYFLTIAALSFIGYQVYKHAEFTEEQRALMQKAREFFTVEQLAALKEQAQKLVTEGSVATAEQIQKFSGKVAEVVGPVAQGIGTGISRFAKTHASVIQELARTAAIGARDLAAQAVEASAPVVRQGIAASSDMASRAIGASVPVVSRAIGTAVDRASNVNPAAALGAAHAVVIGGAALRGALVPQNDSDDYDDLFEHVAPPKPEQQPLSPFRDGSTTYV